MFDIHGLIFDLDGVITDTAEYHYQAWKRLADEENIPFSREDNEALRGVSRRDSLLQMLKGHTIPEETMQAWMARKNEYYVALLENITPADILPGVKAFLEEARDHGLHLGIGSASKNARPVIEKLGLTHHFDIIGDGYVVINSKPYPDLFLWVAGGLNTPIQQCLVFEDAQAGIDAALKAGAIAISIGAHALKGAHLHLDGFTDITTSALFNRLSVLSNS